MRIFFSMWHLGSFRMYEPVLREMASRGHEVHVALGRAEGLGWRKALDTLVADHPSVTWSWLSPPTAAFWAEVAKTIRLWADYLRYFHPDYAETPKLMARAAERMPPGLVRLSHGRLLRGARNRQRLLSVLRACERALPPVPEIAEELRTRKPDLVLVTPLIYLGSSQFEVVREALAQGLRTGYAVGSWDHLSSKALIREMPHRVFVWNETQKDEAVRLHNVPPPHVEVTGAQCYDQWFGRRPTRSREEFCRRVGLPADRPFILYVCSALFWGSPVEAEFVARWAAALRRSAHESVRDAAILVRPHPARMEEWASVDLTALPHVAWYGSNPVDEASKDDYFESLYYSAAVVGLNTSAFLEGAVVGRPVHTVLLPEFHENQEGVLHFHYLLRVGGGVLKAGRTMEEHEALLATSLAQPDDRSGEPFVRAFLRPHGLDQPATPRFCDAVDRLLATPAPAPVRVPAAYAALRWALVPLVRVLRWRYGAEFVRDDWSRKARERDERIAARTRDKEARVRQAEALRQARDARRDAQRQAHEAKIRQRADLVAQNAARKASARAVKAREKASRQRRRGRARLRAAIVGRASAWIRRVRGSEG